MKIEEKIKYDQCIRKLTIKYKIGEDQEHEFNFDLSVYKDSKTEIEKHTRIRKARVIISNIVNSKQAIDSIKAYFEHMAIWYPCPDMDMVECRGYDPKPETEKLRAEYSKNIDILSKPVEV